MPNRVDLLQPINDIADQAGNLVGILAQHNADSFQPLQSGADAIAVKLQGATQAKLSALELLAQKSKAKLDKQRAKLLGNAYQGVFPYGGNYQPMQAVVAGLETGDIFGPVGIERNPPGPGDVAPPPGDTLPGGPGPVILPPLIVPGPVLPPGNVPPPAPVNVPPVPIGGGPGAPPIVPGPTLVGGGGNDGGGWGVCSGGSNPDPVTGQCDPTCPPGWTYLSGGPGIPAGCYPPSTGGGGSTPPDPGCMQFVRVTCAETIQAPVNVGGQQGIQPVCYHEGQPAPDPSWELVTYYYLPPYTTTPVAVQVWIPGTWTLCVDTVDGTVYATPALCSGAQYCRLNFNPSPPTPPPPLPPPGAETCPPIPPLDCPTEPVPPADMPLPLAGWCKAVADYIENLKDDVDPFGTWFGMSPGTAAPTGLAKVFLEAVTGSGQPLAPGLIDRAKKWAKEINRTAANAAACQSGSFVVLSSMRAVADLIQSYLHILPPQFVEFLKQAHNTLCQYLIPSQAEADRAYLADAITKEEWECYTKAAGNLVDPREKLIEADRQKPGPREIDLLLRRGYIDTDEYHARMRAAGVLNEPDKQAFSDLNANWPDKSDLIRYMQRDVFDENVVRQSGLDTDFELKYTGDALTYAAALGLPENHLRYAWRAHWQLPSLTMAGQMLARCRPGRVPDEAVVTDEDVVQLLKQDDWAPKWIPSMMEILKQPLTRVDTRRMFQIHAATEDELKEFYLDLRYDETDADKLVKFAKKQRDVAEAKASGLPTQRTAINQYARGELTSDELGQVLDKISLTPELAQDAKQSAELARTVYRRQQLIKGVKRQFVAGLLDEGEAVGKLLDGDVDTEEIEELINLWQLDRRDRGKHASAAQLCQWRSLNLINPIEQAQALERVGWSAEDAARIVSQCDLNLSAKAAKLAEKAAKESMRQMEKEQAEALKALKARGKIPGPPTRRILIVRDAKGTKTSDTTTVPVVPADADIAAAGNGP